MDNYVLSILLELLPFLIPFVIIQLGLAAAALIHILTHDTYKMGSRTLWLLVCLLINIVGPVLYFILGRSEE